MHKIHGHVCCERGTTIKICYVIKLSVSSLQYDDQVSSAIKKAMIQVAGDRDMAAQETAHMLLSLPLVSCTYSFVTVSSRKQQKSNP